MRKIPEIMAKAGNYSRERDARRAARDKGLKDEEFEILQGPKGWTWREKKKYVKVEDAKLHIGKEVLPKPVPGHAYIWLDPNGRFRWQDETEGLSQESFETIEAAEIVLNKYVAEQLTPKPEPTPIPGFVPGPQKLTPQEEEYGREVAKRLEKETVQSQTREEFEDHAINEELRPFLAEKRVCPECKIPINTYISSDKLFYVEHVRAGDYKDICDMSEEEVVNVPSTGAPQSDFKPHELARISNGDPIPPGTFTPDSLPKRVVIPRIHRSTVENPSKLVWEIAERMHQENPKVARKEVLAECVNQGIAYYTARTQYQVWVTVQKHSAAHADEINKR